MCAFHVCLDVTSLPLVSKLSILAPQCREKLVVVIFQVPVFYPAQTGVPAQKGTPDESSPLFWQ